MLKKERLFIPDHRASVKLYVVTDNYEKYRFREHNSLRTDLHNKRVRVIEKIPGGRVIVILLDNVEGVNFTFTVSMRLLTRY